MPETKLNLNSDKVFVFPTSTRAPENARSGQYLTEYNMTSLINRLTDKAAFVISDDKNGLDLRNFEFNMYGYYFKVDFSNFTFPTTNYIIAEVWPTKMAGENMFYLDTFKDSSPDINNIFKCLNIFGNDTITPTASTSEITETLNMKEDATIGTPVLLTILHRIPGTNNFEIPPESKIKFTQTSIHMDDGDLDIT